jgi:hypothetical protein
MRENRQKFSKGSAVKQSSELNKEMGKVILKSFLKLDLCCYWDWISAFQKDFKPEKLPANISANNAVCAGPKDTDYKLEIIIKQNLKW